MTRADDVDAGGWARRIGPEAVQTRTVAVRAGRLAGGLLIAYVAGLLIVFGLQGFRSTGERMLPNVLLFGSMVVVIACEVVLTIRQQRAMKRLRTQVSAVLSRGTTETRDVITADQLLRIDRFDQWTAHYRLRWFDGTVPAARRDGRP